MKRILLRAIALAACAGGAVLLLAFAVLQWQNESAAQQDTVRAQVESVADVVALDAGVDQLRAALARTAEGAEGDLAVRLPNGEMVGTLPVSGQGIMLSQRVQTGHGTAIVTAFLSNVNVMAPVLRGLGLVTGAGIPALALAIMVGYRRARPLVAATRAIVTAAAAIGGGRAGVELPPVEASEFVDLVDAINNISARVERLIANEREFVADLSHRLRTPLTALRLDSESLADGSVADRIRHAVSTMDNAVDELIRSAQHVTGPQSSGCDVAKVVSDRMAFWSVLARHQGRACEYRCETSSAPVGLPEKDIGAVVDSLIGNIFQHTVPGTSFSASVICHAGWVSLVVEDGGPGIVDVGAALCRGISGRGSTGLGLDIARQAAETTGGTVHIDRGRLGGARIRLRFGAAGAHHSAAAPKAWRLWSRTPAREEVDGSAITSTTESP